MDIISNSPQLTKYSKYTFFSFSISKSIHFLEFLKMCFIKMFSQYLVSIYSDGIYTTDISGKRLMHN